MTKYLWIFLFFAVSTGCYTMDEEEWNCPPRPYGLLMSGVYQTQSQDDVPGLRQFGNTSELTVEVDRERGTAIVSFTTEDGRDVRIDYAEEPIQHDWTPSPARICGTTVPTGGGGTCGR